MKAVILPKYRKPKLTTFSTQTIWYYYHSPKRAYRIVRTEYKTIVQKTAL